MTTPLGIRRLPNRCRAGALAAILLGGLLASQGAAQVQRIRIGSRSYLAEKAREGRLHLRADACFFDGKGLRCVGTGKAPDAGDDLNRGKAFEVVSGLAAGNRVSWFLHVAETGVARVASIPTAESQPRDGLVIAYGGRREAMRSGGVRLRFERAGVHRLSVLNTRKEPRSLPGLLLEGGVVESAVLLRARWRPAAVHARFSASALPAGAGARVWIMELDAEPAAAGFYGPMTTPFGYFGSSWTRDGHPTGLNFSMWSYGRNQKEPPLAELSHLLAVGDPRLRFGSFGHEGTGVKPRGWHPFEDWAGQSCVYALRLDVGTPYDTYSGYYFDERSRTWKLFAAGRKYVAPTKARRRRPGAQVRDLWVGSFVEVPGPPHRQRSGHIVRKLRYRGFVLDELRRPHALDRMSGIRKPPAGNRGRGVTSDGRFHLWTGGFEQFEESPAQSLRSGHDPARLEWMNPERLAALFTWPTVVELTSIRRSHGKLKLRCRITGLGRLARARLYFGSKDALTLAERWEGSLDLGSLVEGWQEIMLAEPFTLEGGSLSPRFGRLLIENDRGKFWSLETASVSGG